MLSQPSEPAAAAAASPSSQQVEQNINKNDDNRSSSGGGDSRSSDQQATTNEIRHPNQTNFGGNNSPIIGHESLELPLKGNKSTAAASAAGGITSTIECAVVATAATSKNSEAAPPPPPQAANNNNNWPAQANQEQQQQQAGGDFSYLDWNFITHRYRKMPRHAGSAPEALGIPTTTTTAAAAAATSASQLYWQVRNSCLCNSLLATLFALFPILTSFGAYRLPGDLLTDLVAGSTVAVLHIPQGMAYGLLSGVDPIYGLYTSFIPVIVMALMSKSRHVSYGTFAILSMMLANACELTKSSLASSAQLGRMRAAAGRPADTTPEPLPPGVAGDSLAANAAAAIATADDSEAAGQVDWLLLPAATSAAAAATGGAGAEPLAMPSNIEILTCVSIMVGAIQISMALLRLGMLSLMFSDQLVSSFTAASAFHVITSQLPNLFDVQTPLVSPGPFKVCRAWWALALKLTIDGFNQYTCLLSLASILFLVLVKELLEPLIRRHWFKSLTCLPSELFLMACVIASSWYWQFEQNFQIEVVGHVPTELPAPKAPRLDLVPFVFQDALTVALVSFAMNLSLGQVYAKRNKYQLDSNQELFALGTSNVVGSFFSCFPCASSLSRTAVQSSLNVKSQICSLFSCFIVVLIICYFAPILHDLPKSTLSCIIIVALKAILFQVKDLYENWRLSKLDAIVWICTFLSVLAFGVTYGLVLGIAASLFMVFVRLLNPNHSILGQLPGTEIYVDKTAFMDCHEIEQVKIFRFNSALCYLNRTMFKSCIEKSLPFIYQRGKPAFVNRLFQQQTADDLMMKYDDHADDSAAHKIHFLVIDCSALAYCDYSGAETLVDLVDELEEHKVLVFLAACPVKLINMIEKMKRTKVIEQNVHPTITDALNHARYLRSRRQSQPGAGAGAGCCSLADCAGAGCLHSVINGLP